MTAAEYERGGKKQKGIELQVYCSKKGKKTPPKKQQNVFSETFRLMVNVGSRNS